MHNRIDYSKVDNAEAEALKDVFEWLSLKQRIAFTALLKEKPNITLEQFRFYASITGIGGYPVEVFYKWLKENT